MAETFARLARKLLRWRQDLACLPNRPACRLVVLDTPRSIHQLGLEGCLVPAERRVDDTRVKQIVLDLMATPPPPEYGTSGLACIDRGLGQVGGGQEVEVAVPQVTDRLLGFATEIQRTRFETSLRCRVGIDHRIPGQQRSENFDIEFAFREEPAYRHRRPPSNRTSCSSGITPVRNSE